MINDKSITVSPNLISWKKNWHIIVTSFWTIKSIVPYWNNAFYFHLINKECIIEKQRNENKTIHASMKYDLFHPTKDRWQGCIECCHPSNPYYGMHQMKFTLSKHIKCFANSNKQKQHLLVLWNQLLNTSSAATSARAEKIQLKISQAKLAGNSISHVQFYRN